MKNSFNLRFASMMPNGGSGSNPSSRRPSLRPPSPGSDAVVAQLQSRRGSRVIFDTKTPPSILRWEILNRVLALSVKGDWPAVDQHLNSLGRNNMEISSAEMELNDRYFQNVKNLLFDTLNRLLFKARPGCQTSLIELRKSLHDPDLKPFLSL